MLASRPCGRAQRHANACAPFQLPQRLLRSSQHDPKPSHSSQFMLPHPSCLTSCTTCLSWLRPSNGTDSSHWLCLPYPQAAHPAPAFPGSGTAGADEDAELAGALKGGKKKSKSKKKPLDLDFDALLGGGEEEEGPPAAPAPAEGECWVAPPEWAFPELKGPWAPPLTSLYSPSPTHTYTTSHHPWQPHCCSNTSSPSSKPGHCRCREEGEEGEEGQGQGSGR